MSAATAEPKTAVKVPLLDLKAQYQSIEQDVLENLNPWDLSIGLAIGALIPIGRPTLTVELGWGQSLRNVTKSGFLPVDWDLPPRFKFSGLALIAGVQFDVGVGG